MKTIKAPLENHETDLEALDVTELGRVSEETKGSLAGHSCDGGWGVRGP